MQAPQHWHSEGGMGRMLAPVGWLYGKVGQVRRACTKPARVAKPVICVGNVVSGGAGKTPVAIGLQGWLSRSGRAVHFLSRGYGGRLRGPVRVDPERHDAALVGDEPLLLARRAPAWVSRDRVAGADAAIADGADLIVMDDGHQNPTLHKDLSLVVVDAAYGFGNGRVMPAGPLREPLACGLARADAVVLVGDGAGFDRNGLPAALPVLEADLVPGPETAALAGRRVFAFAGIGRPGKFFATLAAIGCEVAGTRSYADHHRYSAGEVADLMRAAEDADAIPVTTEKDAVRLGAARDSRIAVLTVSIRWRDEAALAAVMRRLGHG